MMVRYAVEIMKTWVCPKIVYPYQPQADCWSPHYDHHLGSTTIDGCTQTLRHHLPTEDGTSLNK